jgi:hypothetical protein
MMLINLGLITANLKPPISLSINQFLFVFEQSRVSAYARLAGNILIATMNSTACTSYL